MHPHIFFNNYDLSIYIDGSLTILGNLNEFLFRILSPKFSIYSLEHPDRDSLYDEITAVILLQKEKENIGKLLMNRYKYEHFQDNNGLVETCIIKNVYI